MNKKLGKICRIATMSQAFNNCEARRMKKRRHEKLKRGGFNYGI